jgi:hypothetical protein
VLAGSEPRWAWIEPNGQFYSIHGASPARQLEGELYAAGGICPNGTILSSVEAFDIKVNTWRRMPPMLRPRSYFGLAAQGGVLYAIGGFGPGLNPPGIVLASVEAFDPLSEWRS